MRDSQSKSVAQRATLNVSLNQSLTWGLPWGVAVILKPDRSGRSRNTFAVARDC